MKSSIFVIFFLWSSYSFGFTIKSCEKSISFFKRDIQRTLGAIRKQEANKSIEKLSKETGINVDKIMKLGKENPDWVCNQAIVDGRIDGYKEFKQRLLNYKYAQKNKKFEKRGKPTFMNPYKELNPVKNWRSKGFGFKKCLAKDANYFPLKIKEGKAPKPYRLLDANCLPDVVFSWTNNNTIKSYGRTYSNQAKNWNNKFKVSFAGFSPNALYTHMSPIATFAYGSRAMRLKLKKGVRYIWHADDEVIGLACNRLPIKEQRNTVMVRVFSRWQSPGDHQDNVMKTYMELTICAMDVVHSWSYGLPQIYDEQVREYLWVKENTYKRGTHIMYRHKNGAPVLFMGDGFDGKDFTPAVLQKNFQYNLIDQLRGKKGKVFYNPTLPKEEKTLKNHLKSKIPLYWNTY